MTPADRKVEGHPGDGAERPFPVTETSRVVRSPRVREFPLGDDEMMLFIEGTQVLHALNTTAWAVWDLCDGSRTISELAAELSGATGHPFDAVLTDVRASVERLGALALLDLVP